MIDAIKIALSPARIATYEIATGVQNDEDMSALTLYAWNAEVSGALLACLHICEVVVRNAISDALDSIYGDRWPWEQTFERSLPDPDRGYNPRKDLRKARRGKQTTGQVIPELKFVFWQKMFTRRHDTRIWNHHLLRVMPNIDNAEHIPILRNSLHHDLEQLRELRNRIAHHEPIFPRNLSDDYTKLLKLVNYRCNYTADWLSEKQRVTTLITHKP